MECLLFGMPRKPPRFLLARSTAERSFSRYPGSGSFRVADLTACSKRATAYSLLESLASQMLGPDPLLARRENAVGIERVFDLFIETEQGVIVPVVRSRNVVHQCQVRTVLAVTGGCGVSYQHLAQVEDILALLRCRSVEDHERNVVHLAPPDDKGAQIIQAVLVATVAHHGVLLHGLTAHCG